MRPDDRARLRDRRRRAGMPTHAVCLAALVALPGCYLSHQRGAPEADVGIRGPDAAALDAAATDAGSTCTFTYRSSEGTRGACAIDVASTDSCAEAAVCLCTLRDAGTPTEILACAGADLTFRGALTFTDFCTASPPARMNLSEALRGFLGASVEPASGCDAVPALIGTRPFDHCGAIATELCRCVPDCDLDAALGRSCLELTAEQADCVARQVFVSAPDCAFATQLPALARTCGS